MPDTTPSGGAAADPAPAESLADLFRGLRHELHATIHARLHLISLELRQAGIAATQIVLLAALAALFVSTAWTACMAGLYMACRDAGMHWSLALGLVALLNALGAFMLWTKAHALTLHFTMPATLRMLKGSTDKQAPDEADKG